MRDSQILPDGTFPALAKIDDHTVEFTLSKPYRPILSALTFGLMPEQAPGGQARQPGIRSYGPTSRISRSSAWANRADKAYFHYSLDGENWTAIGEPLRMVYTLPHFMGYRFALFNYATKTAGGFADFDYFRLGGRLADTR